MTRPSPDDQALDAWIVDKCELASDHQGNARRLFQSWCEHALAIEAEPGTPRSFSNALRKRGFPSTRPTPGRRRRVHLGLRVPDDGRLTDSLPYRCIWWGEACSPDRPDCRCARERSQPFDPPTVRLSVNRPSPERRRKPPMTDGDGQTDGCLQDFPIWAPAEAHRHVRHGMNCPSVRHPQITNQGD